MIRTVGQQDWASKDDWHAESLSRIITSNILPKVCSTWSAGRTNPIAVQPVHLTPKACLNVVILLLNGSWPKISTSSIRSSTLSLATAGTAYWSDHITGSAPCTGDTWTRDLLVTLSRPLSGEHRFGLDIRLLVDLLSGSRNGS